MKITLERGTSRTIGHHDSGAAGGVGFGAVSAFINMRVEVGWCQTLGAEVWGVRRK